MSTVSDRRAAVDPAPAAGSPDHDDLLRAVELFGQTLEMSGMPRMAARVFAYVLAEDGDRYTAADLARGLRVSPAAISGAVRYLVQARLLFKVREPGTRSDLYRIYDEDVWRAITLARLEALDQWLFSLDRAIELVGESRPGGRRLAETREFFRFVSAETTAMMDRWTEHRRRTFGRT